MTIEERIDNTKKQYVYPNFPNCSEDYLSGFETGYIVCITEQQKIDIDKAIKFMVKLGLFGCEDSKYAEQFRKAMEDRYERNSKY